MTNEAGLEFDHIRDATKMVCDYVLVPKEPTPEMLQASKEAQSAHLKSMTDTERTEKYGEQKKGMGYIIPTREKHAIRYKAMIAAAPQVKTETVDLDALKEKMISDFEEEREIELGHVYAVGLCDGVDYLAQNYNITRKAK